MSTCIFALGQRAAGDDGVGLAVLDALRAQGLPNGVVAREGRDASELATLYDQVDRLVIVDAIVNAGSPGAVRALTPEQIDGSAASAVSSHGVGVGQALELGRTLHPGAHPTVRIVAVTIAPPSAFAVGLSPEVQAAVPQAVSAVLAELEPD